MMMMMMLVIITRAQQYLRWATVATIDMAAERGAAAVLLSRGDKAGSPSNTMSPGPRSTSVPCGVFIHPAVDHSRHGPQTGGCAPFRGSWVPWAEAYLQTK